ncbi:MAG TPA: histidine kinase [Gaiellaceae bacterium]|nr:histidine kinase [Gaiellaceae bacterium]
MASRPASAQLRAPAPGRRGLLLDAALAAVVFALSLALLVGRDDAGADARSLDPLGVALAAVASLPLAARSRAPLGVFVLTAAASAALNALGYPQGPPLGPTVALFFLAASPERTRGPRWLTPLAVIGLFAVHAAAAGVGEDELPTVPILFGTVVWGGAWVIGDRVRQRRRRIAELEERARRAERAAERERRLAAAEERTRIARDLHDSAGHAINVILVQAGAARLLREQDPERSRTALETIEEVARETLGEIDQLVRALREDDRPAEQGTVEPAPGLAAVEALAERHRAAGLDVAVRARGSRRPLPPALDRAAFRILQEALTNAARHGEGSADVEIGYGPGALQLTVSNRVPPGRSQAAGGHGIVGMRERAALLGGSLETETGDGGFRVRARLPYGGEGA